MTKKALTNILQRLWNINKISERTHINKDKMLKISQGEVEPKPRELALIRSYLSQMNHTISKFIKDTRPKQNK